MDFLPSSPGCKQELRPPPCPVCGVVGWWNGRPFVGQMVVGTAGTIEQVVDQPRRRARCKEPDCPCGSWTIYEAGGYPHRTFALAVVAAAIAELAVVVGATLSSVARNWRCDRRTVARWKDSVARTADPDELARHCSSLDPDGFPAPNPAGLTRPGRVLLLLERLAQLLRTQGVALESGPGFGVILRHQFERFRAVSWLTRASQPLRIPGVMALV